MFTPELIVGAVSAVASLTAGLTRILHADQPEQVSVTVRTASGTVKKTGTMRADDVSKILQMVEDQPVAGVAAKR